MGCKDCDESNEGQHGIAYYRWGTANIGVMACNKHLIEVLGALNKVQKNQREDQEFLKMLHEFCLDDNHSKADIINLLEDSMCG